MAVWLFREEAEKIDLFTVSVWAGGRRGRKGQVCACLAEVFSRSASPFLEELQLVGQELVSLACLQSSLPNALYGLCISFQLCLSNTLHMSQPRSLRSLHHLFLSALVYFLFLFQKL